MKSPKYLDEKQAVLILRQMQVENRSRNDFHDNVLTLKSNDTSFIYFEDYRDKQFEIEVPAEVQAKIYMIFKSSLPVDYEIKVNLSNSSELELFSVIRNIEKTQVTINRTFNLARNAKLKLNNALIDMGTTVLNESVNLNEIQASVDIELLNIGSYNDLYQITQDISHNAKSTKSNITNNLISNANSKLKYSVSGRILKGNEASSCKQINRGIILSESGEIEVIPQLFIDEYDVEASHGAAIGQIDDEQLYYLLSRGLSEQEARSLIISGYTKPFIDNIEDEDIRMLVQRQILKRINEVNIQ